MTHPAPAKWSLVTGRDFGRAIRWARTQPTLREILKQLTSKKP